MKKKAKTILLIILTVLFAGALAVTVSARAVSRLLEEETVQLSFSSTELTETAQSLHNPYQGFYRIFCYHLENSYDLTAAENLGEEFNEQLSSLSDERLVLLEINLNNFSNSDLTSSALQQLDDILSLWEDTDLHGILRFVYDWNGSASATEPSDVSVIYTHMQQVANVINEHTDFIYILQGIFIGNYGEMHNSAYMSEMTSLMEFWADVTDPSMFLAVRTPWQLRTILNTMTPLSEDEAFSDSLAARLSLFNDGMLGSESDLGTYGTADLASSTDPSVLGTRGQEIAFQNLLCLYVPNGGEAVADNTYNDPDNAIADLRAMHVSYLNNEYDLAVLNKWASATYEGTDDEDVFAGTDVYTYIEEHLGYRFILRDASVTIPALEGDFLFLKFFPGLRSIPLQLRSTPVTVTISVENAGFASLYKEATPTLTLTGEQTGETYLYDLDVDPRFFTPGEITTFSVSLPLGELAEDTYTMTLSITDACTGEKIAFANCNLGESTPAYDCVIGSLSSTSFSTFANTIRH